MMKSASFSSFGEYGPGASPLSGMMLLYWEATNLSARFVKLPKLSRKGQRHIIVVWHTCTYLLSKMLLFAAICNNVSAMR